MFKFLIYHSFITIIIAATGASFIAKTPENQFYQPFHPTTKLRGSYVQTNNGPGHVANIEFNTNISSLNPDIFGYVRNIQCSQDRMITLTLDNETALRDLVNWPPKVMFLISDKWKCFGQSTTQFYIVGNPTINETKKQVQFKSEPCKVLEWTESYSFDLAWVQPAKPRKKRAKNLYIRDLTLLDQQNKIDLNILFNSENGSSSQPNFTLLSTEQNNTNESFVCTNCFTNGSATIGAHISGTPQNITNATISLSGNLRINVDIAISVTGKIIDFSSPNITIIEIPLSPLSVPGIFDLGPELILLANSKVISNLTGTLSTGGEIIFKNFNFQASLIDRKSKFTGFNKPQFKSHKSSIKIKSSNEISGTLKPQLALGISLLNGAIELKAGIQIENTLDVNLSIGNGTECKKIDQLSVNNTLSGNVGFFVESFEAPVFKFPTFKLGQFCL